MCVVNGVRSEELTMAETRNQSAGILDFFYFLTFHDLISRNL